MAIEFAYVTPRPPLTRYFQVTTDNLPEIPDVMDSVTPGINATVVDGGIEWSAGFGGSVRAVPGQYIMYAASGWGVSDVSPDTAERVQTASATCTYSLVL